MSQYAVAQKASKAYGNPLKRLSLTVFSVPGLHNEIPLLVGKLALVWDTVFCNAV